MKKKTVMASAIAFALAAAPLSIWQASAGALAVWSPVDWESVDKAIDTASRKAEAERKGNENINIAAEGGVEVPAETLRKLAGKNVTLAVHTGGGITVSASGKELKTAYQDLVINMMDEESLIPEHVCRGLLSEAIYSREFAMKEKDPYDVMLNIHLQIGREYAGKYANLYSYDELADSMVCQSSFVVTEDGMAMFALGRGDEYLLTVTEELPAGGRINYTVVEGDCLSRIAAKNGISMKELLAANVWISDANNIHIGDVVAIVKPTW